MKCGCTGNSLNFDEWTEADMILHKHLWRLQDSLAELHEQMRDVLRQLEARR